MSDTFWLPVLEALAAEIAAGRQAVLATIVRSSGSVPRGMTAKMLIRADGTTVGTIGGGAFEAAVAADARDLLQASDASPQVKPPSRRRADALGMACGGREVLLEPAGAGERL